MKFKPVVTMLQGEARIVSTRRYKEFWRRHDAESDVVAAQGSGACEEACAESGGVDECGETWVRCQDGSLWLIDP